MASAPTESAAVPDLDTMLPFTTAQALAAGIPPSRLRTNEYRKLAKGKYVSSRRPSSPLLDAESALLGHPGSAFASHFTAAAVYRMPVPHSVTEHVGVLDPRARRRRSGVRSHVCAATTRVLVWHGVRLAQPADVFIQLAEMLPLVDLVVLGDHIVGQDWHTPEQLIAICAASGEDHASRAVTASRFVRAGVDSPMETRLRMLLVLAGFPEPVVNHLVRDVDGRTVRRFDLSWPAVRVIVEYDGRQHAESPAQYDHDRDRREELDDDGWRLVVVTAKGIYDDPEQTLRRVRKVLRSRGMAGVPSRFHRRWRTHFPGR